MAYYHKADYLFPTLTTYISTDRFDVCSILNLKDKITEIEFNNFVEHFFKKSWIHVSWNDFLHTPTGYMKRKLDDQEGKVSIKKNILFLYIIASQTKIVEAQK